MPVYARLSIIYRVICVDERFILVVRGENKHENIYSFTHPSSINRHETLNVNASLCMHFE